MSRLLGGDQGSSLSLTRLATAVGTNATRLHRVETGVLRDTRLVADIERELKLPTATLRAPIDVMCRTFPDAAPPERSDYEAASVQEISNATEPLLSPPSAGDCHPSGRWFAFARALSRHDALGFPESIAERLIHDLAGEVGRAVGPSYPVRYEALALLRCSGYGHLVLRAAREHLADQRVQPRVLWDLMSAVGEAATPDAVSWCIDLLEDSREEAVAGAVLALESMASCSPDQSGFWESAELNRLTDLYLNHSDDLRRWQWMSHLHRLVPANSQTRAQRAALRAVPLAPRERPEVWSKTRRNRYWTQCETHARAITSGLGLRYEPMLARLLFDVAAGPYETRAVTSYMLLSSLPVLLPHVAESLAQLSLNTSDPVIEERLNRRLAGARWGILPTICGPWLTSTNPHHVNAALAMAGAAGTRPPDEVLARALNNSRTRGAAVMCTGMIGGEGLADLTRNPSPGISRPAQWWEELGPRLTA